MYQQHLATTLFYKVTLHSHYHFYINLLSQLEPIRYRDSVEYTVEENSSIFSVIRMHWLPSARAYSVKLCTNKIRQFLTGGASIMAVKQWLLVVVVQSVRPSFVTDNVHANCQVSINLMDDHRNPGYQLTMLGAPERIFDRCSTILVNGAEQRISSAWRQAFHHAFVRIGGLGERLIGICDKRLPNNEYPPPEFPFDADQENFPHTDLRFLGMISTIDPPRSSVPEAVEKCHTAGVKVIMVTGDHPVTAKAVAKGVGIIRDRSETAEDVAARLGVPVTEVAARQDVFTIYY